MSTITSSNRTRAEWEAFITPATERVRFTDIMAESPHTGVADLVRKHAIRPAGPFDHVIAVDECGAPILGSDHAITCENV